MKFSVFPLAAFAVLVAADSPANPPTPTYATVTVTRTALPVPSTATETDCRKVSICIDYINPCGQWYGGCHNMCSPTPTYTAPPCTRKTTSTTTTPKITTTTTSPPSCSTQTICEDHINSCGMTYGGCHNACKPFPTYTPPLCPTTTTSLRTVTTTTKSADSCHSRTVCVDYVNKCGQKYGGCHADCRPWPTYEVPACPSATKPTRPILPN